MCNDTLTLVIPSDTVLHVRPLCAHIQYHDPTKEATAALSTGDTIPSGPKVSKIKYLNFRWLSVPQINSVVLLNNFLFLGAV